MTGTLINVITVLLGGAVGSLLGGRFPLSLRATLLQGIGLVTLVIGVQRVIPNENPLVLLVSVVIGAVIGETLRVEALLDRFGAFAGRLLTRSRAASRDDGSSLAGPARQDVVARAFITASLIFCVGPMTILGSFEDGLSGAYQTLALKATLDGITAAVLAATLGWGVLLAAVTILVFQGALTLGAGLLRGALTEPMIGQMTAVGGLLILGIGLNILEIARVRVANLLPALVVAPFLVGVVPSPPAG